MYTGDSVDALSEVASNDDACGFGSIVDFQANAGTTYRIAVDGYDESNGHVAVSINEPPPPPPPATRYLALGDSLTVGNGAPPGSSFVELYYEYLRDPAHGGVNELVNLAVGGETSSTMRSRWQLADAMTAINDPSDTQVVTLGIGANDGLSGECPTGYGADSCPFRANYTAIVEALQAALGGDPGDETFQVMQYFNPASGTGSTTEAVFDFALLGDDGHVDCATSGARLGLNDLVGCISREPKWPPPPRSGSRQVTGRARAPALASSPG